MKRIIFTVYLSALVLIAFAGVAACAVAASTNPGLNSFITDTLQPVIVSVIGTIVPLLLALLCRFISKKTGIAISDASQQKLEDIATKAVLYTEEKATASLKLSAEKWPAYLKHQTAVDRVLSLAPGLSHDQADMLVHWAVAKIPGVGSTGVLGSIAGTAVLSAAASDTPAAPVAADPVPTASPADSFMDMLAQLVSSKLQPNPVPADIPAGGPDGDGAQPVGGIVAAAQ